MCVCVCVFGGILLHSYCCVFVLCASSIHVCVWCSVLKYDMFMRPLCTQCNNPLTKEPKLNAAVRIVPEWTSYDNEIKELMQADNSTPQDSPKHTHTEL